MCIFTLTREYHTFSCDGHLMDNPLISKRVDDTIESGEIHPRISLSNEIALEVSESDTSVLSENFDETFAGKGDTGNRHKNSKIVLNGIRTAV